MNTVRHIVLFEGNVCVIAICCPLLPVKSRLTLKIPSSVCFKRIDESYTIPQIQKLSLYLNYVKSYELSKGYKF